ncbi:DJ-1/PfpI family protein [Candidatus Woesearchaeota archaeon]|nr:DJ-1/PfpI family protein [Candidatus Woesearchaeota archaeon]
MKKLFIVFVLFLLVGCSGKPTVSGVKTKGGVDNMAKVLFVIAHENFQDTEFFVPKQILSGHEIIIASSDTSPAKGMLGGEVIPDITIEQALERINEFDAVIFIGGSGSKEYFDNPAAHKIAQNAKNVLAAICLAPIILANAGVLKERRATVWDDGRYTQIKMLEDKSVGYKNEPVVVDGKIVTASGPDVAKEFAERIKDLIE